MRVDEDSERFSGACVVGTTRARGARAAWTATHADTSPFATWASLWTLRSHTRTVSAATPRGRRASTGARRRACPSRDWDVSGMADMAPACFTTRTYLQRRHHGPGTSRAATSMRNGCCRRSTDLTGDISGWNVAAVTDMRACSSQASAFDQDISGWNVAAVTNMREHVRRSIGI